MANEFSTVESAYRDRIDAMSPAERVARSAALFQWTREQIARQVIAEHGEVDSHELKWRVALRLYGDQPGLRRLIEKELARVSD